jgi:hypothetical protein
MVEVWNRSDQPAGLEMPVFTLQADGQAVELASGTGSVAELIGLVPALGADDVLLVAPDDRHEVVLVFAVEATAADLALVAGDATLSLDDVE